jgi:hypothetical protein
VRSSTAPLSGISFEPKKLDIRLLQRISNREEPFQTFQNAAIFLLSNAAYRIFVDVPISVQTPPNMEAKEEEYKNFDTLFLQKRLRLSG